RRWSEADGAWVQGDEPQPSATMLERVFEVIEARKLGKGTTRPDGKSYVRSLLDAGAQAIGAKIREEAEELDVALRTQTDERVASETTDLVFHAMVGLAHRGLHLVDVARELARRFGISGITEKASRSP